MSSSLSVELMKKHLRLHNKYIREDLVIPGISKMNKEQVKKIFDRVFIKVGDHYKSKERRGYNAEVPEELLKKLMEKKPKQPAPKKEEPKQAPAPKKEPKKETPKKESKPAPKKESKPAPKKESKPKVKISYKPSELKPSKMAILGETKLPNGKKVKNMDKEKLFKYDRKIYLKYYGKDTPYVNFLEAEREKNKKVN